MESKRDNYPLHKQDSPYIFSIEVHNFLGISQHLLLIKENPATFHSIFCLYSFLIRLSNSYASGSSSKKQAQNTLDLAFQFRKFGIWVILKLSCSRIWRYSDLKAHAFEERWFKKPCGLFLFLSSFFHVCSSLLWSMDKARLLLMMKVRRLLIESYEYNLAAYHIYIFQSYLLHWKKIN